MLQYLIKFSISLAVLYVFYRAVLRPLTFYQWNRFYLLGYALLSFFIPFVNIAPWVTGEKNHPLINSIPLIGNYTIITGGATPQPSFLQTLSMTDWLLIIFCAGALVIIVKLLLQFLSLRRIRRTAVLLDAGNPVRLYETPEPVSPFSFGNAIYFNRRLHTGDELQRIIQHEFVHVKQKHTIDLIVAELICVVNWFNPFAWLIRYSIRQNLEFIADNKVVANGLDKKEYQYLLLKVVGIPQYSIAGNFNFSNLKKRIAMMNKMKSAQLHLTKFLFVLPLVAVLLLAFRSKNTLENSRYYAIIFYDRQTDRPIKGVTVSDEQNSHVFVTDENGYVALPVSADKQSLLHVSTRFNKPGYYYFERRFQANAEGKSVIELIGLAKGDENIYCTACLASMTFSDKPIQELYNGALDWYQLYFDVKNKQIKNSNQPITDTVPASPAPPAAGSMPLAPPAPPVVNKAELPENVQNISHTEINDKKTGQHRNTVTVTLKDGAKEKYDFNNPAEKAAYIKKYGPLADSQAPVPPTAPAPPAVAPVIVVLPRTLNKTYAGHFSEEKATDGKVIVKTMDDTSHGYVSVKVIKSTAANAPLYIQDGKQITGEAMQLINPDDIASINVLKNESATSIYGDKGKNGVVIISTKKAKENSLPADLLIIVDGKELPHGIGIKTDDFLKPENIESMNVLQGNIAIIKYGDKGKKGAIEIKTKRPVKSNMQKTDTVILTADTITATTQHVRITGGSMIFNGKETTVIGDIRFDNMSALPLVIYNGKEISNVGSFKVAKARYQLITLDEKQGIAKYGSKAKYGALEINRL